MNPSLAKELNGVQWMQRSVLFSPAAIDECLEEDHISNLLRDNSVRTVDLQALRGLVSGTLHELRGERMSEWVYLQADPSEMLTQYHYFSFVKRQPGGDVTFALTVKEFAVPPPGQRVRFYAEADKPVNQKTASFVPCGWGSSVFAALGDCVRLIRQFPFEGEEGAGS